MTRHHKNGFKLFATASIILAVVVLFSPHTAHAGYLDPGSGSTAVQWIVASVATLSRVKRRIVDTFSKIFSR